ncbi:hypothetical protein [Zhongshania aliphaticivorans]|nr:hypothetical protein [Zhongshania aliphaticivorans]
MDTAVVVVFASTQNTDIMIYKAINSEICGSIGDQIVDQGGAVSKGKMDIIKAYIQQRLSWLKSPATANG